MRESVKAAFEEALGQLRLLNPQVELNTDGFDHRAYIDDGVLVSYHSPEPKEQQAEAEDGAEEEANPEGEVTKEAEASTTGTAPPS